MSHMTRDEFDQMRIQQKLMYLWNHGELIAERSYPGSDVSLFLTDGFFAEVFFDRSCNRVEAIERLDNRHILYCYVKDVDLRPLMQPG